MLAVGPAWPGDNPWQFVLAVLIGASSAAVVYHLIPALCLPTLESLWNTQGGRVLLFPLGLHIGTTGGNEQVLGGRNFTVGGELSVVYFDWLRWSWLGVTFASGKK